MTARRSNGGVRLSSLTSEELRGLYRYLVLSRGLEERLEHLLKQGQVVGDLYDGRGQEAAVVGSAFALEEGDWLSPSLREMGALLTRGLHPRQRSRVRASRNLGALLPRVR